MKFYNIADAYIAYLKTYDSTIPDNKNERRPYVGIVLEINTVKYFAPLSSPKTKHANMKNSKDFRKINNGLYGAINFNNMIPVIDEALVIIDIANVQDANYQRLLQNQYTSIRSDQLQIKTTSYPLKY